MLLLQTIMHTALAMSKKKYGTQFEEIFFILNNGITYLFSLLSFKFSLIELEFFSLQNVAITSTTLSWAGCHFSCKTRERHFTDILSKLSYSCRPWEWCVAPRKSESGNSPAFGNKHHRTFQNSSFKHKYYQSSSATVLKTFNTCNLRKIPKLFCCMETPPHLLLSFTAFSARTSSFFKVNNQNKNENGLNVHF